MPGERAHLRVMEDADGQMHRRDQLRGAQCPAPPQHDVVDFLERNAGQLADDVDVVQEILDITRTRFPGPPLFADDGVESGDRGAMAAARVDVDEINLWPQLEPPLDRPRRLAAGPARNPEATRGRRRWCGPPPETDEKQ